MKLQSRSYWAWLLLLAGCASAPPPALSPSILVVPGSGKSFDTFRSDDSTCRDDAGTQAGNVNDAKLLQHRYDFAYQKCMLARGHKIPVAAARPEDPNRVARRAPPPPPPPGAEKPR